MNKDKIISALQTGLIYTRIEGSREEELLIVEVLSELTGKESYKTYRDKLIAFVALEKEYHEKEGN